MNVDGVLYRIVMINGNSVKQVMLPENLKSQVMDAVHDQMGHQAVEKTLALVRVRCFWYSCKRCTLSKMGRKLTPTIGSFSAKIPLKVLAMGYTLLEPISNGVENVLILTDVFTKLTLAVPTRNQTAKTVAKTLVSQWSSRTPAQ